MNTRIQVEHPVTEEVTGYDLVKEQLKVAAGLPLSLPDEVELRGHAIECRINSEDPAADFRPSPGRITTFHPPGGPGVRVDTHVYSGYVVPPYYDSLIAKLIVRARTRDEAIERARLALEMFVIEGVDTTIPFLMKVLDLPEFRTGNFDTRFLERYMAAGKKGVAAR
jgi:acetyl-CoA carboxylase biotin carboxylase subunit